TGADALRRLARGKVEQVDRGKLRFFTAVGAAALDRPDFAARPDLDAGGRAPGASVGKVAPLRSRCGERIRQARERLRAGLCERTMADEAGDAGGEQHESAKSHGSPQT